MSDGGHANVELGGVRSRAGRRWLAALAVAGAWVAVAVMVGSGGGDDDPEAPPPPEERETAPRPRRPTTTSSSVIDGAPLLGRETGWHLVVGGSRLRVLDLDTGVVTSVAGDPRRSRLAIPGRHDGVFTLTDGILEWRPFPFEPGRAVPLGPSSGWAQAVPASDLAWVQDEPATEGQPQRFRLMSLSDGSERARAELPPGTSWPVGVLGEALVVAAAGDTFVVGAEGPRRVADGEPVAVAQGHVLVRSCDAGLRCAVDAVNLATGERRNVPGVSLSVYGSGPSHPDGRAILQHAGSDGGFTFVLAGPDGVVPLLPPGLATHNLWPLGWSPDGTLLLAVAGSRVHVIDPFALGGPRQVTDFFLPGVDGMLAVVQPRSED